MKGGEREPWTDLLKWEPYTDSDAWSILIELAGWGAFQANSAGGNKPHDFSFYQDAAWTIKHRMSGPATGFKVRVYDAVDGEVIGFQYILRYFIRGEMVEEREVSEEEYDSELRKAITYALSVEKA